MRSPADLKNDFRVCVLVFIQTVLSFLRSLKLFMLVIAGLQIIINCTLRGNYTLKPLNRFPTIVYNFTFFSFQVTTVFVRVRRFAVIERLFD